MSGQIKLLPVSGQIQDVASVWTDPSPLPVSRQIPDVARVWTDPRPLAVSGQIQAVVGLLWTDPRYCQCLDRKNPAVASV